VSVRGSVPLHRLAAQAWAAMVSAARADAIAAPLCCPCPATAAARKWVAPPGSSAHQSGRAIDLHLGPSNDSANVGRLRRTPAFLWLVANARRFGFYPYEREPWHWEYNPSAGGGPLPRASSGHSRRLEVPTVPVLAAHGGEGPALVLAWNAMPAVPAEIDVVVHLHGYSRPRLRLKDDIEPFSGLDLTPVDGAGGSGRSRPTLTVLPMGKDTGVRQPAAAITSTRSPPSTGRTAAETGSRG
jgi:hypothetical protein